MKKPLLLYCYDAYCGWCYGFSPVMKQLNEAYADVLDVEVLSGGMVRPSKATHIRSSAAYIAAAYKGVEELTGVKFGESYLWHILNPEERDWYPDSEKPAIALCILKEIYPARAVEIASDLQDALFAEGRDLTDNEAYLHLLEKYSVREEAFFEKLGSEEYKEMALYEFSLVEKLNVRGFPAILLQENDLKFHLVAHGYTDFETLKGRIDSVLQTITS